MSNLTQVLVQLKNKNKLRDRFNRPIKRAIKLKKKPKRLKNKFNEQRDNFNKLRKRFKH